MPLFDPLGWCFWILRPWDGLQKWNRITGCGLIAVNGVGPGVVAEKYRDPGMDSTKTGAALPTERPIFTARPRSSYHHGYLGGCGDLDPRPTFSLLRRQFFDCQVHRCCSLWNTSTKRALTTTWPWSTGAWVIEKPPPGCLFVDKTLVNLWNILKWHIIILSIMFCFLFLINPNWS